MKFLALKKTLEKEIRNVYIVSGNDDFLISQAIQILKEKLVKCFDEFNYQKLDASDFSTGDFKNILSTLPFGDSSRLIVLENLKDVGFKAISEFEKNKFYGVVVVVINPTKDLLGEKVDCDHLDLSDIKKWLKGKFEKLGLQANNDCYDYILGLSNGDLAYINSELVKIAGYYITGETIKLDDLKILLTKNENYFVYNLTNAIDNKDKKSAIKVLNNLQENISIGDIFAFMGPYFRKMFYASISSHDQALLKILRLKPYSLQKARENVIKNGKSFYVNLYEKYTNLDYEIKSGKISPLNAIYSLIIL